MPSRELSRPASMLDRSSPIPFYHQLKVRLRTQIQHGQLRVGDPLPGELRLCEQYAVSRTVVRQALVELEFEGLIDRVKGRGTFVATPKTAQGLVQSFSGQFEDLAFRGVHLRSEVRRLEAVGADDQVAEQLDLAEGAPITLLERLRYVDDEPRVLAVTYLPIELLEVLQHSDLENGSLYTVMDGLGVRPHQGKRTVEARAASTALAHDLDIRRGAPVMLLTSVGVDRSGRPVETFEAFHRGDRSRFEVQLIEKSGVSNGP